MKFLVADDHPIFRGGLREVLKTAYETCEIIEKENGGDVLSYLDNCDLMPDITFLDIDMPVLDGLEVCKEIQDKALNTKCVMLTMHDESSLFYSAIDRGALGFLLKDNSAEELNECIENVLKGDIYISKEMRNEKENRVENYFTNKKNIKEKLSGLTPTELRILKLVSKDKASKEIAEILFVTKKSVNNYRSRICGKLSIEGGNYSLVKWIYENKDVLDSLKNK